MTETKISLSSLVFIVSVRKYWVFEFYMSCVSFHYIHCLTMPRKVFHSPEGSDLAFGNLFGYICWKKKGGLINFLNVFVNFNEKLFESIDKCVSQNVQAFRFSSWNLLNAPGFPRKSIIISNLIKKIQIKVISGKHSIFLKGVWITIQILYCVIKLFQPFE